MKGCHSESYGVDSRSERISRLRFADNVYLTRRFERPYCPPRDHYASARSSRLPGHFISLRNRAPGCARTQGMSFPPGLPQQDLFRHTFASFSVDGIVGTSLRVRTCPRCGIAHRGTFILQSQVVTACHEKSQFTMASISSIFSRSIVTSCLG